MDNTGASERQQTSESEARLRLLPGSVAQAVWETDAAGMVVADSPSWHAYTGQTTEEWLGNGWLNAIHPDDRAFAERQWHEAVAARRHVDAEFRLRSPDGGWRWTNVRAAPVIEADGQVSGWVGLNIDIDARKRAEAALRQSERLRRVALSGGRMGTWRWDRRANLIQADDQFFSLWGLPPTRQALPLTTFTANMAAAGVEEIRRIVAPALAAEEEFSGQLEIVAGPRSGSWVQWQGRAAEDDPSVLYGVSFDVTEQRKAEEALRSNERWQRALIEGIPQLVWRAVDEGCWTWASPQWCSFTGQSEASSHGLGWLEPVHSDDRERVMTHWRGAIERGEFHADYRIWHAREGRFRWFHTRAAPVRNEAGDVIEWLGTSTDIDDIRALQTRQATLLAELQHRVRNILAITRSIISRSDDGNRSTEEYVQHLQGRLGALARTQVVLTRSAGQPVDLTDIILDELQSQAVSEDQYILTGEDVRLSPKTAEVLTLAIHELATNATKYGAFSREGASLKVRWRVEARGHQDWLLLEWREFGVPIVDAVPRRRGFGAELISRRIPYELNGHGSLELRAGGVESRIEIPLIDAESILQTDAGTR